MPGAKSLIPTVSPRLPCDADLEAPTRSSLLDLHTAKDTTVVSFLSAARPL
jgi:hypothetical protein